MAKQLILEINTTHIPADNGTIVPGIMVTPAINKGYWSYRVKLHREQAIVGFPKFGTIGIGFAIERDWNTNLPYTCDAADIYNHIAHNKRYKAILPDDCIAAIMLIQAAVKQHRGK